MLLLLRNAPGLPSLLPKETCGDPAAACPWGVPGASAGTGLLHRLLPVCSLLLRPGLLVPPLLSAGEACCCCCSEPGCGCCSSPSTAGDKDGLKTEASAKGELVPAAETWQDPGLPPETACPAHRLPALPWLLAARSAAVITVRDA